ncbi:MAG: DNA alkylation repair protein, partial [Chloroflexota bacterium]|nr:DNA alkylation repair protein [Chloroflexota bacterium]
DYIAELQERLQIKSNANLQEWWESYLKHEAKFRGLRMLDIQSIVHKWYFEFGLDSALSVDEQKQLALDLFREEYTEDKIAGIVFLQEILLPIGAIKWESDLPSLAVLFREGYISDWNVCDWFCVKVLGPLVGQQGKDCAQAISKWRKSDNLWQCRASGVAFANLAKKGDGNSPGFMDMMFEICAETVMHDERFSQTGTGWLLRELSNAGEERVKDFIELNLCSFSREGLNKATEKMAEKARVILKTAHKDCG